MQTHSPACLAAWTLLHMSNTCRQHAARYEAEFLEDMDALGNRRPDVMTRVSEYMQEIVDYIQTIMGNRMAYESNGSTYFDTQAFRSPKSLSSSSNVHLGPCKKLPIAPSISLHTCGSACNVCSAECLAEARPLTSSECGHDTVIAFSNDICIIAITPAAAYQANGINAAFLQYKCSRIIGKVMALLLFT